MIGAKGARGFLSLGLAKFRTFRSCPRNFYNRSATIFRFPDVNEVFQATSLRSLVQVVADELGITLMPQIAVESELTSSRNVVIRPLSPEEPYRTLVLAWRPTSSRGAEFRMLGNLIRECLNVTQRAFAPDRDIDVLPAR